VSITLTKYYKAILEPWVVLYIDQDGVTSEFGATIRDFPHLWSAEP
jgi:hypothetical protein